MLAANCSRSLAQLWNDHTLDPQIVKAYGSRRDIDDGIYGAYLVKVNLLLGRGMRLCFRLR